MSKQSKSAAAGEHLAFFVVRSETDVGLEVDATV